MLTRFHQTFMILGMAATLLCSSQFVRAQQGQQSRGGLIPNLPLIPEFPTRPLDSQEQPFRGQPTEAESQPSSSFIDSIKVNDAAIEVVLGQGRLITLTEPLANENGVPVIAVANPGIVDFEILPDQRLIRLREFSPSIWRAAPVTCLREKEHLVSIQFRRIPRLRDISGR